MAKNKDFALSVNEGEGELLTGDGSGVALEAVATNVITQEEPTPILTFPLKGEGANEGSTSTPDQYHGRGGSYVVDEATQTRQPGK